MVLEALIPIYILMAIGFALIKSGYIPEGTIRPVNLFIVKIFVPVLIFLAVFEMVGKSGFHWGFILGYGGASVLAMLVGK